MPADSMKNYQHSIMGKKVPQVGGNTPNTKTPPSTVGGNTPNAPKPGRQTEAGGNYAGKGHKSP
jgi:hypothetical protein